MKIAFFGLGGVGGYMAAQMGHHYRDNQDIEFYHIARGEHLEAIKRQGLTLTSDDGATITTHPTLATCDTSECPKMDYVIYATKSYSIDSNIEQLSHLCNKGTTVITFMNGVDGYPKLKESLPGCNIHQGCVYIFSWISSPGHILEKGGYCNYFIGSKEENPQLEQFMALASPAVNKMHYEADILKRVWWKFSRISVFATITTHHNITSGQIKENPQYLEEFNALSSEFFAIAKSLSALDDDTKVKDNIEMLDSSPYGATSSMQRDYHSGKKSELDSLTGYISKMGAILGIATPTYDKAYLDLKR